MTTNYWTEVVSPALDDEPTYKITRFYRDDRPSQTLYTGLTKEQAQAHCNEDWTKGEDWFDGYNQEK